MKRPKTHRENGFVKAPDLSFKSAPLQHSSQCQHKGHLGDDGSVGKVPAWQIREPEVRAWAPVQMPGGHSGPPVTLACGRQRQGSWSKLARWTSTIRKLWAQVREHAYICKIQGGESSRKSANINLSRTRTHVHTHELTYYTFPTQVENKDLLYVPDAIQKFSV